MGLDWRDPETMTDIELVTKVYRRNVATKIPPCHICGAPLSMQACGGGAPTKYACTKARDAAGAMDWDHYSASGFEDRRHADSYSVELARRFRDRLLSTNQEPSRD